MFKKNESYKQQSFFNISYSFSNSQRSRFEKSVEYSFFMNVFCKINEKDFEVLYSNKKSRPNVPVNQLVGALILKHLKNWTYEELFKNLDFNILTRHALGINQIEGSVFSEASIYNFQNRVIEHYLATGTDLLTLVFDNLTAEQIKSFGVKTNIQRGDSFLIGSNIFDYTRLQLLIEVLLRLYKNLDEADKNKYNSLLSDYSKQTAGQYIFNVSKEDLPKEINQLASIYHTLYSALESEYRDINIFSIFRRVYQEHFVVIDNQIEVLSTDKLHSEILLSPDDTTATYRYKNGGGSKGYSGHLSETAHPENKLNLITDITVVKNNTDDAAILQERLPKMIEKTKDIEEYYVDGQYGNPAVDKIAHENSITIIQKAIRGRRSVTELRTEKEEDGIIYGKCIMGQRIKAIIGKTKKGNTKGEIIFDNEICKNCPHKDICRTKDKRGPKHEHKRKVVYYEAKLLAHQRMQNIEKIPKERRNIRANVEATVKELQRGMKNGKSRVRGHIQNHFYMTLTSIAVNLTRIHKYLLSPERNFPSFSGTLHHLILIFFVIEVYLMKKIILSPLKNKKCDVFVKNRPPF